MKFQIVNGETEHISFSGERKRNPTVLLRVGSRSLSRKAFLLGAALIVCQILDGILTYLGLSLLGVQHEGNSFMSFLVLQWGAAPAIFGAKCAAVVLAVSLMLQAHERRWLRPVILGVVVLYLILAIVPWVFKLSL